MRKYYQVFISSVTKDFASIRREIIEAVLSENMFFPIAMEYMKTASNTYSMLFSVPYILGQDHTYQGENSKEAIRTRRERLPGYSEE